MIDGRFDCISSLGRYKLFKYWALRRGEEKIKFCVEICQSYHAPYGGNYEVSGTICKRGKIGLFTEQDTAEEEELFYIDGETGALVRDAFGW